MIVVALLAGYLIGSLPTANGLARLWGVDLRTTGSGNPGANNARRAGGLPLAAVVLLVEVGKGLLAVVIGLGMAGEWGAVLAGISAAAGNVYNVWYGFEGGKGLGISTGVVLGVWPTVFPILLAVLIVSAAVTGSSGIGTLVTLGMFLVLSLVWAALEWEMAWGISQTSLLPLLAAGLVLVLYRNHLRDAVAAVKRPSRSRYRERS